MTLDLTQFHEIFFEESFEALDSMEAALLKLSAGEVDAELINTIFRVAHSIKGGAATFAFNEVAGFTHVLETLLDQLRAGKRQVRPDIVDVLLRSGDAMRSMLVATQRKEAIDSAGVAKLRAELDRIMSEASTAAAPASAGCNRLQFPTLVMRRPSSPAVSAAISTSRW
jgi:two-component system chemotaxis sensor kinase CheA